ncbi:uncharacterized protein LOC62_01G001053 [Vanrija pseudolonga]|uniref:Uncharacterized protein n=1 Tax=Vanrija pseudolonga TaxID=143232 RepID=A0AAF1BIR2_9TREE|nr:hypothetical protein LOC62_01G001053 [Vanrija pseudolonga]
MFAVVVAAALALASTARAAPLSKRYYYYYTYDNGISLGVKVGIAIAAFFVVLGLCLLIVSVPRLRATKPWLTPQGYCVRRSRSKSSYAYVPPPVPAPVPQPNMTYGYPAAAPAAYPTYPTYPAPAAGQPGQAAAYYNPYGARDMATPGSESAAPFAGEAAPPARPLSSQGTGHTTHDVYAQK